MLFGMFCNQKSCQCQQQKIGKEWRKSMKNFGSFLTVVVQKGEKSSNVATATRELFKNYFMHEGAVSWQDELGLEAN